MATATASLYAADYKAPTGAGAAQLWAGDRGGLRRTFAYCVAGTMGLLTPQLVESRNATSIAPMHYKSQAPATEASPEIELERTPAQDLALIRSILRPTVLELANLFGVSRQAIYDWQNGAQPAPQTAVRLAQLAQAAAVLGGGEVAVDFKTLRRKMSGGRTFVEAVLTDGDAVGVAQRLLPTLLREAEQRQRLQRQLAGRARVAAGPSDYGAAHLAEDA